MRWVATAVWSISDVTTDRVVQAADDLDGDVEYNLAAGLISVHFDLVAVTRDEAVAVAGDLAAALWLPPPVAPITAHACHASPLAGPASCHVDALTPEMNGSWMVKTQGSQHVWNLDQLTYTRIPGPHSRSGGFAFDHRPMAITRVERWPRVGSTSLLWYNDPTGPDHAEHWRQSSKIVSITEISTETK